MITIESLVDMGANVKLEVTPTDLKMFAESIIQRTIMAQQEEQKAAIQREAKEIYLNTKQVRELLNVCDGTLNLWLVSCYGPCKAMGGDHSVYRGTTSAGMGTP